MIKGKQRMKILALDSSGLVASAAIVAEDVTIAEYTVNHKKTHSQTLLPMLDEIRRMTELDLSTIDAIAIACGPGSFTGLRIGAATAKGLGLALNIPIIPVPTVDSLAYNLYGSEKIICPLMDARRNQVYTGLYTFKDGELVTIEPQCAVDIAQILDKINAVKEGHISSIKIGTTFYRASHLLTDIFVQFLDVFGSSFHFCLRGKNLLKFFSLCSKNGQKAKFENTSLTLLCLSLRDHSLDSCDIPSYFLDSACII